MVSLRIWFDVFASGQVIIYILIILKRLSPKFIPWFMMTFDTKTVKPVYCKTAELTDLSSSELVEASGLDRPWQ